MHRGKKNKVQSKTQTLEVRKTSLFSMSGVSRLVKYRRWVLMCISWSMPETHTHARHAAYLLCSNMAEQRMQQVVIGQRGTLS